MILNQTQRFAGIVKLVSASDYLCRQMNDGKYEAQDVTRATIMLQDCLRKIGEDRIASTR